MCNFWLFDFLCRKGGGGWDVYNLINVNEIGICFFLFNCIFIYFIFIVSYIFI